MTVELSRLVHQLNAYLNVSAFSESAINGLQVAGPKKVNKVAFAVDGVLATFEEAAKQDADLLIVHHGIYWGFQYPLRGTDYKRIKTLMDNDIALYAVHLPLDAHAEVGHNVRLLKELGADPDSLEPFGNYKGMHIGWRAQIKQTKRAELDARLEDVLGGPVKSLPFGPEKVRYVSCITGAGADFASIREAKISGVHYHISGEADHPIYHYCKENHVNLALGGHYRTEVWGLYALREYIEREFGVETCFIDHPTEM